MEGNQLREDQDPAEDSGHVSNKPGYGWESDTSHLAGEEPRKQKEVKVPVAPVMPVSRESTPEKQPAHPEPRAHRSAPSWPFWWLLFLLLLLGLAAVIAFQLWDTDLIRRETNQSEATLHSRIDSTESFSQNRLENRAIGLENRLEILSQKVTQLQVENAALKARLDSVDLMCQRACQQIEK